MTRVVRDLVQPLGAHGFRLTDQMRAESAVMRAAKADMMRGSMMIKAASESGWGSLVHFLFQVGKG